MPKISDIEFTPNPEARKFILKEPLTFGIARSYESASQATDDELAKLLFQIPHVTNVFYVDNWVTVTQDGEAEWTELQRQIAGPLREAPAAINESKKLADAASWLSEDSSLSEGDKEKLEKITDLLDSEVRPYLQGDGGDLYVVGLADNVLQVHYQGACGSCPSSLTGTLAGIQGLVNQIDPELEVIAV